MVAQAAIDPRLLSSGARTRARLRRRWIDLHQGAARPGGALEDVHNFIFRCPVTGLNVQGTKLATDPGEGPYTPQKCLACGGVHLVNAQSGKLLSEEHPRPRPDPG